MNWKIESEKQHLDGIRAKYAALHPSDLEIRVISEGSLEATKEDWNGWMRYISFRRGWRFDRKTNAWVSPEEPLTEPQTVPIPIDSFRILSDFSMQLPSSDLVQLRCSYLPGYYDSVIDIKRWLEQITRGEPSRVSIDLDDKFQEYISYPKDRELVRLVINYYSGANEERLEQLLDALVPKRVVVDQFYRYILDVFCAKHRPEEYQVDKNDYRSESIEDFLTNSPI